MAQFQVLAFESPEIQALSDLCPRTVLHCLDNIRETPIAKGIPRYGLDEFFMEDPPHPGRLATRNAFTVQFLMGQRVVPLISASLNTLLDLLVRRKKEAPFGLSPGFRALFLARLGAAVDTVGVWHGFPSLHPQHFVTDFASTHRDDDSTEEDETETCVGDSVVVRVNHRRKGKDRRGIVRVRVGFDILKNAKLIEETRELVGAFLGLMIRVRDTVASQKYNALMFVLIQSELKATERSFQEKFDALSRSSESFVCSPFPCEMCEDPDIEKRFFCARCELCVYCSKECQAKHWPEHKKQCNKFIFCYADEPHLDKREDYSWEAVLATLEIPPDQRTLNRDVSWKPKGEYCNKCGVVHDT